MTSSMIFSEDSRSNTLCDYLAHLLYIDDCLPNDQNGWHHQFEATLSLGGIPNSQSLVHTKKGGVWGGDVGMIVEAACGGGKTTLLSALKQAHKCVTGWADVSVSALSFNQTSNDLRSGDIEASIFSIFTKCLQECKGTHLILLDDIDSFFSQSSAEGSGNIIATRIFSALMHCLDMISIRKMKISIGQEQQCEWSCFVVATCTSPSFSSPLFNGLSMKHRLGEAVHLPIPSLLARSRLFTRLLLEVHSLCGICFQVLEVDPAQNIRNDEHYGVISKRNQEEKDLRSKIEKLSSELALVTQGYSATDVIKLVKDQLHQSYNTSSLTLNPTLTDASTPTLPSPIDATHILHRAKTLQSTAAMTYDVSSFMTVSSQSSSTRTPPIPTLIGIDNILDRLKREVIHNPDSVYRNLPSQTHATAGRTSPLQHTPPSLLHSLQPSSGIVIQGPSGSGKTSLALWLAGAAGDRFKCMIVPCADLVQKVVGESEKKIAKIFAAARAMAPCFLILDNLDIVLGSSDINQDDTNKTTKHDTHSFASQRTTHKAIDRILSTLLIEIDGLLPPDSSTNKGSISLHREKVIVIATTTKLSLLDRALNRPGRLELHISLDLPNVMQRKALLQYEVKKLGASHQSRDKMKGKDKGIAYNTFKGGDVTRKGGDRQGVGGVQQTDMEKEDEVEEDDNINDKDDDDDEDDDDEMEKITAAIAENTNGYSPAQLKQLVQEATLSVLRDALPSSNMQTNKNISLQNPRRSVLKKLSQWKH